MGVRAAPFEYNADFPARLPPPGVQPNFVNPPSRARIGCICVWLSTAAMLLCIAVRAYSRLAITRTWGRDDCMDIFCLHSCLLLPSHHAPLAAAQCARYGTR